jgi:hypothetical protein
VEFWGKAELDAAMVRLTADMREDLDALMASARRP